VSLIRVGAPSTSEWPCRAPTKPSFSRTGHGLREAKQEVKLKAFPLMQLLDQRL